MTKTTTEGRLEMRLKAQTPHDQIGYELVWIIGATEYPIQPSDTPCQFCGLGTIVPLPPPIRAIQPDSTTHVCHPALGGCNWGYERND